MVKLGVLQACPHIHADPPAYPSSSTTRTVSHRLFGFGCPRGSDQAMKPQDIARARLKWGWLIGHIQPAGAQADQPFQGDHEAEFRVG